MTEKRVFSELGKGNVFVSGVPVNNVYRTDDYSIFQFSKFNRNILLRKEMLQQAKEGFLSPIIVNENLMVIDGQHRLKASEQVGVPVEFIIKPGLNEHDIVRMNTVQKPWSLKNFIEAFANQGEEEYIKLVNLLNQNYADTTSVLVVSTNTTTLGGLNKRNIQDGEFKFFNYEKAIEFLTWYKNEFRKRTNTPVKSKVCIALWGIYQIEGIDLNRIILKTNQDVEFVENIKTATMNQTDATRQFIDRYNAKLSKKSGRAIEYYISSKGNVVVESKKADWATVD
ncbi:TPA: ParB N-terminal domain-containing protein [Enterococcus faecium]